MYAGGGSTHAGVSATGPSSSSAASAGASSAPGSSAAAGGSGASHAFSNALAEANDLDALVFEFGTSRCKLGFAGEDFPRVFESALPLSGGDEGDAARRAARLELDAEQQAQWLFDAAAARLHTRVSDHPLLLVERPFALPDEVAPLADAHDESAALAAAAAASSSSSVSSKKQHLKMREQMVEVLMEQLGSPALFCAKSAVLTCYANARTSGLVVEMGATYTSVTSVHEGYAFASPKSQVHVFGGFDLDAYLRAKLAPQLAAASGAGATSAAAEIARRTPASWSYAVEAKESGLCRVADSAFDEAQNAQLPMINYELPDKTVVAMGTERFSVPEQYFVSAAPSSSGPDAPVAVVKEFEGEQLRAARKRGIALPEFVCEVGGMTTEAELRKELFQNVVLTGGSSCFENLPTRLEREVVNALGSYQLPLSSGGAGGFLGGNLRVKVVAAHASERKIGAFLGGSILASLGSFHEMWMSKAEYAEHGATLIHKKCP
ncbi:hypothetical protein PybrP1_008844 [[Pythium] brassicae (nom. inval.)]|nr:hypothetical protein PybrP1_008844 [[Pythium] brassicae (nom. inval.)]